MITNIVNKVIYVGDGQTKEFLVPFPFGALSDLVLVLYNDVTKEKREITTNWSYDENTRKITYPSFPVIGDAISENERLIIYRKTPLTQEKDHTVRLFTSQDVERMTDKLTMEVQDIQEQVDRAIKYDVPFNGETDAETFVKDIEEAKELAEQAAASAQDAQQDAEDAAGLAEQAAAQAQAAEQAVDGAINTHNQDATAHPSIQQQLGTIDGQIIELQNTKYAADIDLSINSSTFVVTTNLKDQDGNIIGTAKTIDLPLESVVVSGSYDAASKKVVLTLQNGSTIEFSVAELVAGLQSEITSSNKLSADLVDDTSTTHKFVTASDKSTWNAKQDAISDLATIRSGAAAGATALQPEEAEETYLQLAGGTMTGDITWTGSSNKVMGLQLNNNGTNFDGGWNYNSGAGAGFALRSTSYATAAERGAFVFFARNGTSSAGTKRLMGFSNGSLTWAGSEVLTVSKVDGTTIKANSSNVISVDQTALTTKQDTISDLSAIRSGAELGATSVQYAMVLREW